MTVLSHQSIKARCESGVQMVVPYDPGQVRTASYDLRMGEEYFLSSQASQHGSIKVHRLGADARSLEIPANQLVVVSLLEKVQMPADLVGHLSLKVELLLRGLIMASQSQIDAGYRGPIFALLYNLSDKPVELSYEEPVLRLEFAVLDAPTEQTYAGGFHWNQTLADVLRRRLTSSLESMHEAIARFRRIGIGVGAGIGLTIVGLIIALLGPVQQEASDAKSSTDTAQASITRMQAELDHYRDELATLRRTVQAEQRALSGSTRP